MNTNKILAMARIFWGRKVTRMTQVVKLDDSFSKVQASQEKDGVLTLEKCYYQSFKRRFLLKMAFYEKNNTVYFKDPQVSL